MKSAKDKIPLKKALFYIFLSLIFSFTLFSVALFFFQYLEEKQGNNEAFEIQAIEQIGKKKEALKTEYFAELLNLSQDKPQNLYRFSLQEGTKTLLASPLLENASLQKIFPSTLRIEYTSRVPLFIIGDYTNTVIDKEGVLFPERPFYTPKKLPEVFLPEILTPPFYGEKISKESLLLLKKCYQVLTKNWGLKPFEIKRIDLSQAFNENLGKQELVFILEEKKYTAHLLRLSPPLWESQLELYFTLKRGDKKMIEPSCNFPLFDLRLRDLCLIKYETLECGVK